MMNTPNRGNLEEYVASLRRTVKVAPGVAVAWLQLGDVLRQMRRFDEASAACKKAVALAPRSAEAHENLARTLRDAGQYDKALASFLKAIEIKPDLANAHEGLGMTLLLVHQPEAAEKHLQKAIALQPADAVAHHNLGVVYQTLGRTEAAEKCLLQVVALRPDHAAAYNNLAAIYQNWGQMKKAEAALRQAVRLDPTMIHAFSNLLFVQQHTFEYSPLDHLRMARAYGAMVAAKARPLTNWTCEREPKKLRVGFVSGDLYDHVVGHFLEGVLKGIDVDRVELFAYANYPTQTPLTHRIRPHFTGWRQIDGLNDEQAANLISNDGIHVLIDLSGHTTRNRLPMFAWKPAPVQATWIGYFGTTGVEAIDYFITDKRLIPPEEEHHFTEKPWRLSASAVLTPPSVDIQPNALPVLSEGVFTFGCFNNLRKVNDKVVVLWSRILKAAPGARLLLKAPQFQSAGQRASIRERFAAEGVPDNQILIEEPSLRDQYFASYQRVDAALDPFPYTGATTSIEGMWMGVPVLTLKGDRFLAHVGEAVAHRAGLSDWVATDEDDYVAKALALVADPSPLVALRANLRQTALATLYDGDNFADELVDRLWEMWRRVTLSPVQRDAAS